MSGASAPRWFLAALRSVCGGRSWRPRISGARGGSESFASLYRAALQVTITGSPAENRTLAALRRQWFVADDQEKWTFQESEDRDPCDFARRDSSIRQQAVLLDLLRLA